MVTDVSERLNNNLEQYSNQHKAVQSTRYFPEETEYQSSFGPRSDFSVKLKVIFNQTTLHSGFVLQLIYGSIDSVH